MNNVKYQGLYEVYRSVIYMKLEVLQVKVIGYQVIVKNVSVICIGNMNNYYVVQLKKQDQPNYSYTLLLFYLWQYCG